VVPNAHDSAFCLVRVSKKKLLSENRSLLDHDSEYSKGLWRIITTSIPRMTAPNAANAFPAADQESVFAQGQNKILAAGRMKPTRLPEQRAQAYLITAYQKDDDRSRQIQ
jgi:hypothetical protein